jgi:serine/threonine-protein kinase RsbW
MTATHYTARTINNSNSAPFVELHQSLASRAAGISSFVDQLMLFIKLFIRKVGGANKNEDEIETAVHEAVVNAIVHGNRENPEKRVYIICRCSMNGEVVISVRDEGAGFDYRAVPDPTGAQRLLLIHGRGLHIMKALMDEVWFEENGTVVLMRKRIENLSSSREAAWARS